MVEGIYEHRIKSLNNNKGHMNLQISHIADFNTSVSPFAVVDGKKTNLFNKRDQ